MIPLPSPVTVPAQQFDSVWITSMSIQAPSATNPVNAFVTVVPYNSQTKQLGTQAKNVQIKDVFALAATNTSIAAVLQNMFAYVTAEIAKGTIKF